MIYGLGERLYKQRQLLRLSQKEVAAAVHVSPSIISNYENGERTPSLEILIALANLYRCSTDYLLGYELHDKNKSLDASMLNDEQRQLMQCFLYSLR